MLKRRYESGAAASTLRSTHSEEATLDAKRVSTLLALIPDRVARQGSGVPFAPESCASRYPERIAHLARQLGWLTPLASLTIDDQRILGLVNAAGRPVHAADLEDGIGDGDPEDPAPVERIEHALA